MNKIGWYSPQYKLLIICLILWSIFLELHIFLICIPSVLESRYDSDELTQGRGAFS